MRLRGRDRRRGRAAHLGGLRRRPARHGIRPRQPPRRAPRYHRPRGGHRRAGRRNRRRRTGSRAPYGRHGQVPERSAAAGRARPGGAQRPARLPGHLARARVAARLETGPVRLDRGAGGRGRGLGSVRQAEGDRQSDGQPRAPLPRLRRARRHAARLPGRPLRRPARNAADRRPDPSGPRGGTHARPGHHAAQAARQRRGGRPRQHLRGDAARAGRRPAGDRGDPRSPAGLRRRRLARAAHPADQHPRQPGAAGDRAGRRAARDGRFGAALVEADAATGRGPAPARPRRRRPRGAARPGRPRRGRARGRPGGRCALLRPSDVPRPPRAGHHRRGRPTTSTAWRATSWRTR